MADQNPYPLPDDILTQLEAHLSSQGNTSSKPGDTDDSPSPIAGCYTILRNYIEAQQGKTLNLDGETLFWYKQTFQSTDAGDRFYSFIRNYSKTVTQSGFLFDHLTLTDSDEGKMSDDVGTNIIKAILKRKGLLAIQDLLGIDTAVSLNDGAHIGGWGDSLFYWKTEPTQYAISSPKGSNFQTEGTLTGTPGPALGDQLTAHLISKREPANFDNGGEYDRLIAAHALTIHEVIDPITISKCALGFRDDAPAGALFSLLYLGSKTATDSSTPDDNTLAILNAMKNDQAPKWVLKDVFARALEIFPGAAPMVGSINVIGGLAYDEASKLWVRFPEIDRTLPSGISPNDITTNIVDANLTDQRNFRLDFQKKATASGIPSVITSGPTPYMGATINDNGTYTTISYLQAADTSGEGSIYTIDQNVTLQLPLLSRTGSVGPNSNNSYITSYTLYTPDKTVSTGYRIVATASLTADKEKDKQHLKHVTFKNVSEDWSEVSMYFLFDGDKYQCTTDCKKPDGSTVTADINTATPGEFSVTTMDAHHENQVEISVKLSSELDSGSDSDDRKHAQPTYVFVITYADSDKTETRPATDADTITSYVPKGMPTNYEEAAALWGAIYDASLKAAIAEVDPFSDKASGNAPAGDSNAPSEKPSDGGSSGTDNTPPSEPSPAGSPSSGSSGNASQKPGNGGLMS